VGPVGDGLSRCLLYSTSRPTLKLVCLRHTVRLLPSISISIYLYLYLYLYLYPSRETAHCMPVVPAELFGRLRWEGSLVPGV
jgi:hypothetical protein